MTYRPRGRQAMEGQDTTSDVPGQLSYHSSPAHTLSQNPPFSGGSWDHHGPATAQVPGQGACFSSLCRPSGGRNIPPHPDIMSDDYLVYCSIGGRIIFVRCWACVGAARIAELIELCLRKPRSPLKKSRQPLKRRATSTNRTILAYCTVSWPVAAPAVKG